MSVCAKFQLSSWSDIDSVERIDANWRRKLRRNDANRRRFWTGAELMQIGADFRHIWMQIAAKNWAERMQIGANLGKGPN